MLRPAIVHSIALSIAQVSLVSIDLTPAPVPAVTPLSVGQAAPFNGMLLPNVAALGLAQRVAGCEARSRAEAQRTGALLALQAQQALALRGHLVDSAQEAQRCDVALQKAQAKVVADGHRLRPWLWVGVGMALGAGMALGLVAPQLREAS